MPPAPRKAAAGGRGSAGRPVRDANFLPKRERKQVRKSMVRAYLANRIGEARVAAADRAEFYRNLRYMKMRRREIAKAMRVLSGMTTGLQQDLRRVEDRDEHVNLKILDEALDLAKSAAAATDAAASEFELFARRRIYYTELVA